MGAIWILQRPSVGLRSPFDCGVLTFLKKLHIGIGRYDIGNTVIGIPKKLDPRDRQGWPRPIVAVSSQVSARTEIDSRIHTSVLQQG